MIVQTPEGFNSKQAESTVLAFLAAWSAQDLPRVVEMFDEHAIFKASIGPEPGQTYIGRGEIEPAIRAMFERSAGTEFEVSQIFQIEGGAVVTWIATSAAPGARAKSPGIDLFQVRDGKITLKDAYRKVKPQ